MRALFLTAILIGITTQTHAGEEWKEKFFKAHPEADTNKDGELSWPEYKEFKKKLSDKNNNTSKRWKCRCMESSAILCR